MDVRLEHVGVGCNRVVNAASWGPLGLVAFGAHNAVALYNPEVSGETRSTVAFLQESEAEQALSHSA